MQIGKQRAYRFGTLLRRRYSNLLSHHYKSEEVYAKSTDVRRTKDTTKLVLAGVAGLEKPPSTNLSMYLGITGPNRISGNPADPLFRLDKCPG